MSDQNSAPPPASPPPPGPPPGPPPADPPPPSMPGGGGTPPGGGAPPGGGHVSENRTVMIVLSYLWILALVPYLIEKEDREVQWHAKHGLVWTGVEILAWIVFSIINTVLGSVIPGLGCLGGCVVWLVLFAVFLGVRVMAIVKGTSGERFIVPGISEWADRF